MTAPPGAVPSEGTPPTPDPALRAALHDALAAVAPETDLAALRGDRPLGEQVELDSLDWLNLAAALQERLPAAVPDGLLGRQLTPDALLAALAGLPARDPAGAPAPPPRLELTVGGATVTVRPMRPDDAEREADFVRGLSDEARYKRFMGTLRELTPNKLRYLTDVDQQRHVALVASVERDGREVFAGVARYVVDPGGGSCEFAVTVADAWQGSGLAGVLMQALMRLARARGLQRMEGVVLAMNRRMLKFARQLGFALEPMPDDARTVRAWRAL